MSDQDQPSSSGNEQTQSAGTEREGGGDAHTGERGGARRGSGRRRHGRSATQSSQGGGQQQPRRSGGDASLNMDELRELTELFTEHRLTDFEFENADIRVRLSRNAAPQAAPFQAAPQPPAVNTAPLQTPPVVSAPPLSGEEGASPSASGTPAVAAEELHIITSPIVGTFYRSPSPESEFFVKAGSHVEQDTVICIIEAMKLMNEIQADTAGTIEKIYVENGQPVEYGQPLFGIKK